MSHSLPNLYDMHEFDPEVFKRTLTREELLINRTVFNLVWGRHHDQASADRFAGAIGARVLVTGHQSSLPGVKAPTSRHIMLTSDGPLGTVLPASLEIEVPQPVLIRQVRKIRSLRPEARL